MADTFPRQSARTQRFTLGAPRTFSTSADGSTVTFLRSRGPEDAVNCLWDKDVASGEETLRADPAALLADVGALELPAAERARRERAREGAAGIVGYSADLSGTSVAFALAGRLYVVAAGGPPRLLETAEGVFDPRMSPDAMHVSFVIGDALHVVAVEKSVPVRLLIDEQVEGVSWGSAEFVAGEEMGRTRGHWWSPDGDRLVVARVDVTPVATWHIADPAQPWREPMRIRYPAAGAANADVGLSLVALAGGHRTAIDWDRDALPYLVDVTWNAGEPLTLVASSRDQLTMAVLTVDPESGASELVRELTDPTWVEIVPGAPRWMDGELVVVVERAGTRSVLHGDRVLSPPEHWVRGVVNVADGRVIYTASLDPTEVRLFEWSEGIVAELAGSGGVVAATGGYEVRVEVAAQIDTGSTARLVGPTGTHPIRSLAAEPLVSPRVELLQAGDRGIWTAVLFPSEPEEHGAGPLPVLLDPYGGPHAQRVLRSRNAYLTSQWFADQGYCVVVADGRGTPGRGGGWEQAVRGDLAGPVLDDQIAALDAVAEAYGDRLDLDRVAIRGWSFGGYLAALAVLRRPDRFQAGIAGAPVTDWRWYDTHYTERYLGHPDTEPENYERSSLINEAHLLRRPLLIIHGLADDNVVAAHSLQLSNALLAAGRPHEMLPLVGVTHMTPQEEVAENLLLFQVDFLRRNLGPSPG